MFGGTRVPLSGAAKGYKNDVILENGWSVEVKRRKDDFKTLYKLFEGEGKPDALALRSDKKPWLIVLEGEKFIKILKLLEKEFPE